MPSHRLFLAFLPPRPVAEEIDWCRTCFGRCRTPVAIGRLHLTLLMLGDHEAAPRGLAAKVRETLLSGAPTACRIVFDTLVRGGRSTLLAPSEPLLGVAGFQRRLAQMLARASIAPPPQWRFSPHITLGYGQAQGATRPIDPISWTADELVLVHSLVGQTRHVALGRWPLARD